MSAAGGSSRIHVMPAPARLDPRTVDGSQEACTDDSLDGFHAQSDGPLEKS